jgi:hypothetical protein
MELLASLRKSPLIATALVLAGLLLIAAGYWGPWVWAEPAGLRVLGLDLAEYVKFIAEVRSGQVTLVREVFYLPLVALSLSLGLLAHRSEVRFPGVVRWVLNLLAVPTALAMLPPAWTPALLLMPEFIKQTVAIGLCMAAAVLSYPVWRRLPGWLVAAMLAVLALLATGPVMISFMRLRGPLDAIYGKPIEVGRGPVEMVLGFGMLCAGYLMALGQAETSESRPQEPALNALGSSQASASEK